MTIKIILEMVLLVFFLNGVKGQLSITPSGIVDVTENSRFTITCSYTGSSAYSLVVWSKDGLSFAYIIASNCSPFAGDIDPNIVEFACTSRIFSLTFKEVKKYQDGERWSCRVDTAPETVSAEVTIKIKVQVTSVELQKNGVTISSDTLVVDKGVPTTLGCNIIPSTSRPPPSVIWYIGTVKKQQSTTSTSYTVIVTESIHNKDIYCKAYNLQPENQAVESSQPRLYVRVQVASVELQKNGVTVNTGTVEVDEGVPTKLVCNILPSTSRPAPTVIWYIGPDIKQQSTNTNYTVTASEADHDKSIYCKSYNLQPESQAVESARSKLLVRVPVSFVQLKKDNIAFNGATLTVTAGSIVSLSCSPGFSRPSPPTIDWYIGSVLKLSDSVQYRYTAEANDHTKTMYCQAYIPQQTMKAESNKPMLNINVEGVTMSIVPSTVLLNYVPTRGDGQPVNTVFTCGGFKEMNVKYIQNLKIFRLTRNDLLGTTGVGPVIATIDSITKVPEIILQELQSRATVDGYIETLDWTASTLSVTFETAQLQCKDEGMYTCEINYETNAAEGLSPRHSTNLTTNAQPEDVSMTASKNGMQISTFTGTIGQPEPVTVGDTLQFKCTGLLGNLQDAKITWMRTSLSFTSDEFIDMNPGITLNDGNETAGAITELPDQCSRRQTNTLTYVIQNTDKSKPTLAFKCYIQATPPQSATGGQGGIKIIVNSTTAFYMKVEMGPQATSTEAQTNNLAGPIEGGVTAGVLVTLGVLIVIFVYLHRKGYIVKKKNKSAPPEHTYYNTSTKEKVQAFHTKESSSAGQSLEPAKYEDLSQNGETTSTYDTIEASLHADYGTRNEESTYEGLKQDMEPSQAYATLTQESRTNTEAESSNTEEGSSTYNNLMLN